MLHQRLNKLMASWMQNSYFFIFWIWINCFLMLIWFWYIAYRNNMSLLERCWSICSIHGCHTLLFALMQLKPPCLLNNYRCPEVYQISSVFLHHTESHSFYSISNVVLCLSLSFFFLEVFHVAARWSKITRLPVVWGARKQQWEWFQVALSY